MDYMESAAPQVIEGLPINFKIYMNSDLHRDNSALLFNKLGNRPARDKRTGLDDPPSFKVSLNILRTR